MVSFGEKNDTTLRINWYLLLLSGVYTMRREKFGYGLFSVNCLLVLQYLLSSEPVICLIVGIFFH